VLILSGQFMLPDSQNLPTAPAQLAVHKTITHLVPCQLLSPESTIGSRLCSVARAAVPEATIHKNGKLEFWKNEIRFAEDRLMPPPAGDVVTSQNAQEREFCPFISTTAHASHDVGALSCGEDIGHTSGHEFAKCSSHLRSRTGNMNWWWRRRG